nr:transporter substrate-binding domain-containing protein [uncultured Rhodoferax sp.]
MYLFNGVLLLVALLAGGPWASAQPQTPVLQALTESLPPLNYEQDGKITGFASELLDLMAAEAGISLQKQLLPWVRAYDRATKPGDTVLYSLVRTPEREPLFRWVGPIGPRRILLYKWADRTDIQPKTLDDVRNYRIGTTLESAATKNLIKQGFVPMPVDGASSGLEQGVNDEQNMRKFIAKRFDLLVSLDWAAAYNAKNAGIDPADLVPALVLDDSLNYWYGLNLSVDPDVAKRLNAALQKLRNDGRYAQLRQKYLLKAAK